jgi:hypothetical protein
MVCKRDKEFYTYNKVSEYWEVIPDNWIFMTGAFHICFVAVFHETHISYKHVVSDNIKLRNSHFNLSTVELIVLYQKCHEVYWA